jgi:hypothetical protein
MRFAVCTSDCKSKHSVTEIVGKSECMVVWDTIHLKWSHHVQWPHSATHLQVRSCHKAATAFLVFRTLLYRAFLLLFSQAQFVSPFSKPASAGPLRDSRHDREDNETHAHYLTYFPVSSALLKSLILNPSSDYIHYFLFFYIIIHLFLIAYVFIFCPYSSHSAYLPHNNSSFSCIIYQHQPNSTYSHAVQKSDYCTLKIISDKTLTETKQAQGHLYKRKTPCCSCSLCLLLTVTTYRNVYYFPKVQIRYIKRVC